MNCIVTAIIGTKAKFSEVERKLKNRLRCVCSWGRYIYAIGGNEMAARMSGVPVATAKTFAYIFSGMCAALAGLCQAAQELA